MFKRPKDEKKEKERGTEAKSIGVNLLSFFKEAYVSFVEDTLGVDSPSQSRKRVHEDKFKDYYRTIKKAIDEQQFEKAFELLNDLIDKKEEIIRQNGSPLEARTKEEIKYVRDIFMRGIVRYELRNYAGALQDLESIEPYVDQHRSDFYRVKGESLFALKRYDEAIHAYKAYLFRYFKDNKKRFEATDVNVLEDDAVKYVFDKMDQARRFRERVQIRHPDERVAEESPTGKNIKYDDDEQGEQLAKDEKKREKARKQTQAFHRKL